MLHLIAFAKVSNKQYAYDYVVKNKQKDLMNLSKQKQVIISQLSAKAKSHMTFHTINNECLSFNEIIAKDPYFADTQIFSNWIDFVKTLNAHV